MAPFGYRIVNAEAVVDSEEAESIRDFFEGFVSGGHIKTSAEEAGIGKASATCKKMLCNQVYLGTDYYPQIIPPELFQMAQERLKKVCRERKGIRQIPTLPVYTRFMYSDLPAGDETMSPEEYAACQFGRIKRRTTLCQ